MRKLSGLLAAVTLVVSITLLVAACGGGGRGVSTGLLPTLGTEQPQTGGDEAAAPPTDEAVPPSEDKVGGDEPENGTGGEEGVSPPSDAPTWTGEEMGIWWDPVTGEPIPIIEGFASLGMKGSISEEEESAFFDTIEERGYAVLFAYPGLPGPPPGIDIGNMYEIQLPPGVTFAEAYRSLMAEFGDLIAFLDPEGIVELHELASF